MQTLMMRPDGTMYQQVQVRPLQLASIKREPFTRCRWRLLLLPG